MFFFEGSGHLVDKYGKNILSLKNAKMNIIMLFRDEVPLVINFMAPEGININFKVTSNTTVNNFKLNKKNNKMGFHLETFLHYGIQNFFS